MNLGRYDEAKAASLQGLKLAERTYGEHHSDYWVPASNYARLLHLNGEREAARQLLAHVFELIPKPWSGDAWKAVANRIDCLVAEGGFDEALPLVRAELAAVDTNPDSPNAHARTQLRLGQALWQAGQPAEAVRQLREALQSYIASEPATRQTRLWATGLLGRFLLAHGKLHEAEPLLQEVIAKDGGRHLSHTALARADLSVLLLARGQAALALSESATAQQAWREVRGFRDVRMGAHIDLSRARVLLATGDAAGAQALAESALQRSLQWDGPQAHSVQAAREVLAASKLTATGKPAP